MYAAQPRASAAGEPICIGSGAVLGAEEAAGLHTVAGHAGFAEDGLDHQAGSGRPFLLAAPFDGQAVRRLRRPGKGNTLLNHCGIRSDLLSYTVDRQPVQAGHVPARHAHPDPRPDRIVEDRPDYVLVLPWNLRTEITEQLGYVRDWGGTARLSRSRRSSWSEEGRT